MNLRPAFIFLHKRYLSPSLNTCVHLTTGSDFSGSLTIFSCSQEDFVFLLRALQPQAAKPAAKT
jgi:hypothetical protein